MCILSDYRDDLQYGSVLCHQEHQGGYIRGALASSHQPAILMHVPFYEAGGVWEVQYIAQRQITIHPSYPSGPWTNVKPIMHRHVHLAFS